MLELWIAAAAVDPAAVDAAAAAALKPSRELVVARGREGSESP